MLRLRWSELHREAVSDPSVELQPTWRQWGVPGLGCAPMAPVQVQESENMTCCWKTINHLRLLQFEVESNVSGTCGRVTGAGTATTCWAFLTAEEYLYWPLLGIPGMSVRPLTVWVPMLSETQNWLKHMDHRTRTSRIRSLLVFWAELTILGAWVEACRTEAMGVDPRLGPETIV